MGIGDGIPSGPGSGVPFGPGSGVSFGPGSGVNNGLGDGLPAQTHSAWGEGQPTQQQAPVGFTAAPAAAEGSFNNYPSAWGANLPVHSEQVAPLASPAPLAPTAPLASPVPFAQSPSSRSGAPSGVASFVLVIGVVVFVLWYVAPQFFPVQSRQAPAPTTGTNQPAVWSAEDTHGRAFGTEVTPRDPSGTEVASGSPAGHAGPAIDPPTSEAAPGEVRTTEGLADAPTPKPVGGDALAVTAEQFPRIGVELRDLSSEDRSQLGLSPEQRGALVVSVVPGSAAEDARLQPNDVVVSLNFEDVGSLHAFIELVRSQRSGVEVPISFYRRGIKYTKNIAPRVEE